jgi:hypothetical protein
MVIAESYYAQNMPQVRYLRPAQKKRAGMNFEFEAFRNFKRDIFEFMPPATLRPRTQNSYLLFSFAPVLGLSINF